MADSRLDAVCEAFAELTGALEDAALIASVGQGVKTVEDGRRQLQLISKEFDRIGRCLDRLQGLLR
ncbi:MAG: hypothetical protein IKE66_11105 [Hyphomicrobium sp.]|nr:hypothetical protein [Hyphomicrobium sp.]